MIWIIGVIASIVAIIAISRPILAARDVDIGAAAKDMALYKDQLTEVESDLSRGVLSEADATAARLEISRRILGADKRAKNETGGTIASPSANIVLAALVGVVILGGGIGGYALLGQPGMPDHPLAARLAEMKQARANRPNQQEAEERVGQVEITAAPEYIDLVAQLRLAVEQKPNDEQGLRLLALHEFRLGNYRASRIAQSKFMEIITDAATAKDYSDFAEVMIFATNGYVSPEAELALSQTLKADPTDGRARYYSGLALIQNGRADVAFNLWSGLLAEGPSDAPWLPLIAEQIDEVARLAGIRTLPGPTADQVAAAGNLSNSERTDMIRTMVNGLSERLGAEGGSPQEWARLIRALGVLGETSRASAIWNEAQDVFAKDPNALATLRVAAQDAKVSN